MQVETLERIDALSAAQWNALAGEDYPFLRHEFLHALEASDCLGHGSGWSPRHLLIRDRDDIIALLPLYLKQHSWGEYVFDWSWATAYQRHGLKYYPKLLSAVPFTPAAGPRLALASGVDARALSATLIDALAALLEREGASSWHLLFPDRAVRDLLAAAPLLERQGMQYHWFNRGYRQFEDFLAALTARKRKAIRRERRQVAEQGLRLERVEGPDIGAALWQRFYDFYQMTYAKRSGHGGYLSRDFFTRIGASMPGHIMMVVARAGSEVVAAALNLFDRNTLYGRYWGCSHEFAHLHFETCYYQGIEFCIEKGLARFDAGAQGEHKIQRGFEPVTTRSLHLIRHPDFHRAIAGFVDEEAQAVRRWIGEAREMLPYRRA